MLKSDAITDAVIVFEFASLAAFKAKVAYHGRRLCCTHRSNTRHQQVCQSFTTLSSSRKRIGYIAAAACMQIICNPLFHCAQVDASGTTLPGHTLAAYIMCSTMSLNVHISRVAVLQAHRRKGIARMLMRVGENELHKTNAPVEDPISALPCTRMLSREHASAGCISCACFCSRFQCLAGVTVNEPESSELKACVMRAEACKSTAYK